ncbi:MAG: 30S ribosomal protein S12 methylthiotransferase RimO [Lentisphaeria bacterium]|nr:30S ribosomal protein S12 methylthiotransferase RimO [Lentisphaeria bacterium]
MPSKNTADYSEEPLVAYIVSLGCAKNLVDAEVICGTLAANGIYLTDDPEDAHVIIINTCGFIQSARDEAEAAIKDAVAWKKRGQKAGLFRKIVVGGCLAQRSASEYALKYPLVDCWTGIDSAPVFHKILEKLVQAPENAAPEITIPTAVPQWLYDEKTPRIQTTPESYAYVKIAEGCNHRCAFCAIPGIRGNLRSRSVESIVAECKQFLDNGVRELDLIAQDTTAYGIDRKPRTSLADIIRELEKLPGEFWIRVLYTHPVHLTQEFIDLLGTSKHLVPYLDIPLQHINSAILKSMRRGMNGDETKKLICSIREKYPQMTIRTTLMTGYPGETDEAFQQLLSFVQDFQFDRLGAFAFSPEPGTPAFDIKEGRVPWKLAEARRDQILAAQKKISLKRNQDFIGKTITVLAEEKIDKRHWVGRSQGDAPEVDQTVAIDLPPKAKIAENSFVQVKITRASEYDLGGILQ